MHTIAVMRSDKSTLGLNAVYPAKRLVHCARAQQRLPGLVQTAATVHIRVILSLPDMLGMMRACEVVLDHQPWPRNTMPQLTQFRGMAWQTP